MKNNESMFQDYEQDPEALRLQRQQKLIDAIQAQAIAPMQGPAPGQSGPYTVAAKLNPLEGVAKLLQAYIGKKQSENLAEEKNAYQQKSGERLKGELNDYFGAADKREALTNALSSSHPIMRGLAMAQLEAQMKSGGRKLMQADPGKTLVDENTGEIVLPTAPQGMQPGVVPGVSEDGLSGPGWKMVSDGRGGMARVTALGLDPYDKASKTTTSVSVNASPMVVGQKEGMKEYWGDAAKQVAVLGNSAAQGQQMLPKLNKLEKLEDAGVFSNVTATPAIAVSNFAQALGVNVDANKLANSEQAQSISKDLWVGLIKEAGGARGYTEAETKKIEAIVPSLSTSSQARREIVDMMKQKIARDQAAYRHANKAYATAVASEDTSGFADAMEQVYLPSAVDQGQATSSPQKVKKYNPATGRIE